MTTLLLLLLCVIAKENVLPQDMRALLDAGSSLPFPDGILINGLGPNQATFNFEPGKFSFRFT